MYMKHEKFGIKGRGHLLLTQGNDTYEGLGRTILALLFINSLKKVYIKYLK